MVALWLMAQAAFGAVKLWVLPGTSVEVVLIPTWCTVAFAFLYGLWCLITAAVGLGLNLFDDDNQEETQCECKN
jgi:hypothetical protein